MLKQTKYQKEYEEALLNPPLCGCFCGERIEIKNPYKWYGITKYIRGHNVKTKEGRILLSDVNKNNTNASGHVLLLESLQKMKNSLKGRKAWNKGLTKDTSASIKSTAEKLSSINKENIGEKNGFYGKNHSNLSRLKIGKASKGKTPSNKGFTWEESYGIAKAKKMKENQKQNGYRYLHYRGSSSIEIKLQEALTKENISFETHKPITGQPDIFISPNVCVFADGDYWHGNPNKYKDSDTIAIDKTAQQIWDKDKKITQTLQNKGYIVLRFWEHEINNNVENCISKILE